MLQFPVCKVRLLRSFEGPVIRDLRFEPGQLQ